MSRSLGSTDLKRLHREWRRQAPGRLALLLDSVATPANVGSILRTAAALRVDDVWVCGQTADPERGHGDLGRAEVHQSTRTGGGRRQPGGRRGIGTCLLYTSPSPRD